EILLFSLGTDHRSGRKETFGINVFKVREVMRVPEITRAPEMPSSVEGMVSLRGVLVPVIDLIKYAGIASEQPPEIMIVTEYNGRTQGFLVESVDTILRLEWSSMRVPPDMLNAQMGGLVTAVTELSDGRLIMVMDVEKILAETTHSSEDDVIFASIKSIGDLNKTIFFTDDSYVARKQIERTLEAMSVNFISSINGGQAWEELKRIAQQADSVHRPVKDFIQLILTDVEMPEMDGYMLTKLIKGDPRFAGIPVIMHSSLSGMSNQQLGRSVGVDEYISKFEPQKLASALTRLLSE
ncbi:MAG: chemotaxis protein, partial [Sulfuricellaceae bacterium]|nr:chemotaxis protein [Sulfuricellaceae bacterium]